LVSALAAAGHPQLPPSADLVSAPLSAGYGSPEPMPIAGHTGSAIALLILLYLGLLIGW
jgi:hypothetical protein